MLPTVFVSILILLTGCVVDPVPGDDLFPGQVGQFLRISGPVSHTIEPEVSVATYEGPDGTVNLHIRRVESEAEVDVALNGLPPLATNVGYDPSLGQREGVYFTFGGEFHAAWGNAEWVFVLSTPDERAREVFLGGYGF